MKTVADYIKFLEEHPSITDSNEIYLCMRNVSDYVEFLEYQPCVKEKNKKYAEDIFSLPKKTRNDVLFLLESEAFGNLNHIVELVETCRTNKIKINRLDKDIIKLYCEFKISAIEITQEIRKKDMNRLTPQYYEAPCKISNSDAVNKLKGNK